MQYPSYTRMKRKAYKTLNKLMTPHLWEQNAKGIVVRDLSVELSKLSVVEQYAIAIDTLDRSSCFCNWFSKGILVADTMPMLKEFFQQLKATTQCVHTLRLICEVQVVIEDAYALLRTWSASDEDVENLDSNKEKGISELWESYFIASDSFLEIADKWFKLQIKV